MPRRAGRDVVRERALDAPRALEEPDDLERGRAQQRQLARIRGGTEGEPADGAHDVLGIARLEELDRVERLMGLGEEALEVFGRGGWRLLARAGEGARGVARSEVQLVE